VDFPGVSPNLPQTRSLRNSRCVMQDASHFLNSALKKRPRQSNFPNELRIAFCGLCIVDVESRSSGARYKFYCDVTPEHSTMTDQDARKKAMAAVRAMFERQGARQPSDTNVAL